jgi:hypothetical protein
VVANFVVTNDVEEEAYLQACLGEAAGEYRLARFYLMRQILHMSYTVVFLQLGSADEPIDPVGRPPVSETFITACGREKSV